MNSYYREKPKRIEAYQVGSGHPPKWLMKAVNRDLIRFHNNKTRLTIKIPNGVVRVNKGDYVYKDKQGMITAMKKREFEAIYSKITTSKPN